MSEKRFAEAVELRGRSFKLICPHVMLLCGMQQVRLFSVTDFVL